MRNGNRKVWHLKVWHLALLLGVLAAALAPRADAKSPRYWPVLTQGDHDDEGSASIAAAQYLLRARGYQIAVDGEYGKQTTRAVKAFQKKRGLVQNGNLSGPVWEALIVTIKKGSAGDAVRAAQNLLRRQGYDVKTDGKFGEQTARAVRKFQDGRGIGTDGVVGPFTWNYLLGGGED